ncbi:MAG: PaaI family thioesterase [Chloroflexota bacterium]|nr:PaaI family thioesterase [Chloroflexota bacterium]
MSSTTRDVASSREILGTDGRRYAFADHNCFACGGQNPIGMRLEIELGDGTARTVWTAGTNYVGWEDKIHGGILATLLDEVMAWAPSSYDSWAVTAELNLRFRAPANPGERLVAEAQVTGRRRRIYEVHGEVHGEDGRMIAEADGRFLGATPSQKRGLKQRYGMPVELPAAGARRE